MIATLIYVALCVPYLCRVFYVYGRDVAYLNASLFMQMRIVALPAGIWARSYYNRTPLTPWRFERTNKITI